MLIINLCGAPGAGKSTGAAYVFSQLKMEGVNAELITEFAKDKTWEHNSAALSNQVYMFGKQLFRISRCADQVDVIVTDSPLFLSILYNRQTPWDKRLPESFENLVCDISKRYDSLTYLVKRVKPYNPVGRNQTAEESDRLHVELKELLETFNIPYQEITGALNDYNEVVADTLGRLYYPIATKKEQFLNRISYNK